MTTTPVLKTASFNLNTLEGEFLLSSNQEASLNPYIVQYALENEAWKRDPLSETPFFTPIFTLLDYTASKIPAIVLVACATAGWNATNRNQSRTKTKNVP